MECLKANNKAFPYFQATQKRHNEKMKMFGVIELNQNNK